MNNKKKNIVSLAIIGLVFVSPIFRFCHQKEPDKQRSEPSLYLNHNDSVHYVGMNECRKCHENIYQTFIKTGMGRSFESASSRKTSATFFNSLIYDSISDMHYHCYLQKDSLYIQEFRPAGNDTLHTRTEQVNYIIGSGQHTNSHLMNVNGYIHQMPMTFYTQKGKWDLPPGFENGMNTRFSRKIGLECMSCHNGYPQMIQGSENKYSYLPQGIDCERCHGPGETHVKVRSSSSPVDTSREIDYTIVNPSKLPADLQFDVCQRCHLQGNAVLKTGKSFFDFKPGMKLSDFISVFLPKYKNADDEFIMASHADRLKQSACFVKSLPKANVKQLKPYTKALTCVTCHNPHISVKETNKEVFNDACKKCHSSEMQKLEKDHSSVLKKPFSASNCVWCHMPASGSTDIPHVSVHDHYIRKPITREEKEKIKIFIGLYSVNEKKPDALTRAKAFIQQFDKFEGEKYYLDSALALLKEEPLNTLEKNIHALIHAHFIRNDFAKITSYVDRLGELNCMTVLFKKKSWDNENAWTSYRIADAYFNTGKMNESVKWFSHACQLAPFNLDFRLKYGNALANIHQLAEAESQFRYIISENPKLAPAYGNLGYIKIISGMKTEALRLYKIGLTLDPDNSPILLNLAAYYYSENNITEAKTVLLRILKHDPKNPKAKEALKQLGVKS